MPAATTVVTTLAITIQVRTRGLSPLLKFYVHRTRALANAPELPMSPPVYSLAALQATIAAAPDRWRPLVFTNGCFDLLHVGHLRYLQAARRLGQALVVGVNSDRSVRALKPAAPGYPPRPIVPEQQRAELLAALKPVDGVVLFAETTACQLITALQPEIYVKGGDYTLATLPERATLQAYGGQIELISIEIPTSTSAILDRILGK